VPLWEVARRGRSSCAVLRQTRAGAWLFEKKRSAGGVEAGRGVREEAGFTARVDVKHGLPRELHTAGRICDILWYSNNQTLRGATPIPADISLTHPFIGNAVDRDRWGTYPPPLPSASLSHLSPSHTLSITLASSLSEETLQRQVGPAVPSFRALSGRLKCTVRRHKFRKISPFQRMTTLARRATDQSRLAECVIRPVL
jgi:hypothetical protein